MLVCIASLRLVFLAVIDYRFDVVFCCFDTFFVSTMLIKEICYLGICMCLFMVTCVCLSGIYMHEVVHCSISFMGFCVDCLLFQLLTG